MRIFQLQRLTAVGLIFCLTVHMIVVHYPPFHIDFSRIMERMANPWWKAFDIFFLAIVLVHALAGMIAVLLDVERVTPYKRALVGAATVIGVIAFIYGTQTVLAFQVPEVAMP